MCQCAVTNYAGIHPCRLLLPDAVLQRMRIRFPHSGMLHLSDGCWSLSRANLTYCVPGRWHYSRVKALFLIEGPMAIIGAQLCSGNAVQPADCHWLAPGKRQLRILAHERSGHSSRSKAQTLLCLQGGRHDPYFASLCSCLPSLFQVLKVECVEPSATSSKIQIKHTFWLTTWAAFVELLGKLDELVSSGNSDIHSVRVAKGRH